VDGQNYYLLTTIKHDVSETQMEVAIGNFEATADIQARYVKLIAKSFGAIPSWHPGAGSPSWIFVDEIVVE